MNQDVKNNDIMRQLREMQEGGAAKDKLVDLKMTDPYTARATYQHIGVRSTGPSEPYQPSKKEARQEKRDSKPKKPAKTQGSHMNVRYL